jgi:hypothetical protein
MQHPNQIAPLEYVTWHPPTEVPQERFENPGEPQLREASQPQISQHAHSSWLLPFRCPYLGCQHDAQSDQARESHFASAHPCAECGLVFSRMAELNEHAWSCSPAFKCHYEGCSSTFSHYSTLERHYSGHLNNTPRFPCPHCQKYQGDAGFKRRDHLTQHLRGYHHIGVEDIKSTASPCPHANCEAYREGAYEANGSLARLYIFSKERHAFSTPKDFQNHMRKVHDETPFQCSASGCDRHGAKGYFRIRDLEKHQRKEHNAISESLRQSNIDWLASVAPYFKRFVDKYWH